jgi:hypothetical protein
MDVDMAVRAIIIIAIPSYTTKTDSHSVSDMVVFVDRMLASCYLIETSPIPYKHKRHNLAHNDLVTLGIDAV